MLRFYLTALLGFSLFALVACDSSTTEPNIERRRGVIAFYGDPVRVTVPDSMRLGLPAKVTVETYGSGCDNEVDTSVAVEGNLALVEPYEYVNVDPGVFCPAIVIGHTHEVTIMFKEPGMAKVRIIGRREPGDHRMTVERSVVVVSVSDGLPRPHPALPNTRLPTQTITHSRESVLKR